MALDDQRDQEKPQRGMTRTAFMRLSANDIVVRAEGDDDRTVELSISSEQPARQWFGTEVLDHTKGAVDLEFMNGGSAPVLLDHNHRDQIGVIEKAWLDEGQKRVRAVFRFSRSARAEEILQDIRDGIRTNVSIGYEIREIVERSDDEQYRVTEWWPYEASIVSVPADRTVGVGRAKEAVKPAGQEKAMSGENTQETVRHELPAATPLPGAAVPGANGPTTVQFQGERELNVQFDERMKRRNEEVAEMIGLGAIHNMSDVAREYAGAGKSLAEFTGYVRSNIPEDKPLRNDAIGLTPKETRQFSIMKLANAANPQASAATRALAQFEAEAVQAAEEMDNSGTSAKGLRMPREVLNNWIIPGSTMYGQMVSRGLIGRRDLNVGNDGDLVATDHLSGSFIDVLRNASSVMTAGPTILQGLQGNVDIPKKATASAATWVNGEGTDATESEATYGTVALTPKDLAVYTDMTRRIRQQASPDIEMLTRMDIIMAIALGLDSAALEGSGAAGQPTGVLNTAGLTKVTTFAAANPTFAEVVSLETAVANDNALMGNLAYIGRTNMRGALKTTKKDAGSGDFVYENNEVNGYRYIASNQGTDGNLYFGNWSDVLIGTWGTLDLQMDYAALALSGGLRMIAFQTVDVNVRHIESFAYGNDTV